MNRLVAFAVLLAATACAQVPRVEELPTGQDGGRDGDFNHGEFSFVPELRPAPTPSNVADSDDPEGLPSEEPEPQPDDGAYRGPPRIDVSRFDATRFDEYKEADGTARCPFDVTARGFPAARDDGKAIVSYTAEVLSSSSGQDEIVTVRWVDVDTDAGIEQVVVVDGDEDLGNFHCWRWYKRARARAAEVNAKLSARWEPMQPLDLWMHAPGSMEFDVERDDADHAEPAQTRPVELTLQHREVVVRIPGVRVFARADADWGIRPDPPDDCWFETVPAGVWADRRSGVVALRVEQHGGPCYCYEATLYHALGLPPEAFDAIDRRNSDAQT